MIDVKKHKDINWLFGIGINALEYYRDYSKDIECIQSICSVINKKMENNALVKEDVDKIKCSLSFYLDSITLANFYLQQADIKENIRNASIEEKINELKKYLKLANYHEKEFYNKIIDKIDNVEIDMEEIKKNVNQFEKYVNDVFSKWYSVNVQSQYQLEKIVEQTLYNEFLLIRNNGRK